MFFRGDTFLSVVFSNETDFFGCFNQKKMKRLSVKILVSVTR